MSLSNKELQNIQPVNMPRKKIESTPTKTAKAEVDSRHQKPSDVSVKSKDFGFTKIDPDVIESQFVRGLGSWHPSNVDKIPLPELQEQVDILQKSLGPRPAAPTTYSLIGDRNQIKKPFDFYKKLGGQSREPDCMNQLDIEQTPISIEYFIEAIIRKLSLDTTYHTNRARGYISYFKWAIEQLENSLPLGEAHNEILDSWEKKKKIKDSVFKLMKDQANYDRSLTDQDRRVLIQEEERNDMKATLQELVNQTLIKAGVLPDPKPKRRPGRPKKSEMESDV